MSTPSLQPWRTEAACRGAATSLFFPDPADDTAVREAKAICAACCVVVECRAHVLLSPAERGIWGGLTEQDRQNAREHRHNGGTA
jgi:WhiB family redox-sensing transcriptional regulator